MIIIVLKLLALATVASLLIGFAFWSQLTSVGEAIVHGWVRRTQLRDALSPPAKED